MLRDIYLTKNELTEYVGTPLIADDIHAYRIILCFDGDLSECVFQVKALRADGAVITDAGMVSGRRAEYVLASNMYSVEGELKIRASVAGPDGGCLTEKEAVFTVLPSFGEASVTGDDRYPILNSLISQVTSRLNGIDAKQDLLSAGRGIDLEDNVVSIKDEIADRLFYTGDDAPSADADFVFFVESGRCTITGYSGSGGRVVIPYRHDGLPVTTIAGYIDEDGYYCGAFEDNKSITSVVVPDTVKTIGVKAFNGCSGITSLELGGSVESVSAAAFSNCPLLSSATLPDSVMTIGEGAFSSCGNLSEVRIKNPRASIGTGAFAGCHSNLSVLFGEDTRLAAIGISDGHIAVPRPYGAYRTSITSSCSILLPAPYRGALNQFVIHAYIESAVSITLGTNLYFNCEVPDISIVRAGHYDLIYEYDNALGNWVVGAVMKGSAA